MCHCHLQRLINLNKLEIANFVLISSYQVKGHPSLLLIIALCHCMVLLHAEVTCVQWSIYFYTMRLCIILTNDRNLHRWYIKRERER